MYLRCVLRSFLPIVLLGFMACKEEKQVSNEAYKGPDMEIDNIEMLYSDSAKLAVKMLTAKQLDLASKDKIYPKEIKLYFFDKLGNVTTTLRGDSGRYVYAENVYKVKGHVKVENTQKMQTLESNEMTWYPAQKIVKTNQKVKVTSPRDVYYGSRMTAKQDFSQFSIIRFNGQTDSPVTE
jgi:LPS export ABC transporter protein LptC